MAKLTGWTSGLYLTEYDTDLPDGTEVGFDADLGLVYAHKGKVVTAKDLPANITIIKHEPKQSTRNKNIRSFGKQRRRTR